MSLAHQLSWRVRPVGDQGVGMQVNPHVSDLSRCRPRHPGLRSQSSRKQTADDPETYRHPREIGGLLVMERRVFTDS